MPSGDCTILNAVWTRLWDPTSQFYFPTIARKGLNLPDFGINIAPFDTVNLGDLPTVTMFKEPVLGYMTIDLTSNALKPLSGAQGSGFTCNDGSPTSTQFGFTLSFPTLDLGGAYTVSAGGGIGGCAIAAAAAILGGSAVGETVKSRLTDSPVDQNVDLALWYQGPLGESENGRNLLGAYDTHQDSIYDLQQNPAYQQAALRSPPSQTTTGEVTAATVYYRNLQTGLLADSADPPPTVGTVDQYNSGQLPYAYLLALANQKVQSGQDPDGHYAALYQSMIHFMGSVTWVQKTKPGPHPVGGEGGVLDIIANADPDEIHAFVMANGPYPIANLETGEVMLAAEPKPLDYAQFQTAGRARVAKLQGSGSAVDGDYVDTMVGLSLTVAGTLTTSAGKLQASITQIQASLPALRISLHQAKGWWPGLYDKVTNWIANDTVLNGSIKGKLTDALSGDDMRKRLTDAINGVLSSL